MKDGAEKKLYPPFAKLANACLKELRTLPTKYPNNRLPFMRPPTAEALFHVNDPMPIRTIHPSDESTRKPDLVMVSRRAAAASAAIEGTTHRPAQELPWDYIVDNIANTTPKKNFDWDQVLLSLEFKPVTIKNPAKVPLEWSDQLEAGDELPRMLVPDGLFAQQPLPIFVSPSPDDPALGDDSPTRRMPSVSSHDVARSGQFMRCPRDHSLIAPRLFSYH